VEEIWIRICGAVGDKVLFKRGMRLIVGCNSTDEIAQHCLIGPLPQPAGSRPMREASFAKTGWAECGLLRCAEIILGLIGPQAFFSPFSFKGFGNF
jgi:hypothetical protein